MFPVGTLCLKKQPVPSAKILMFLLLNIVLHFYELIYKFKYATHNILEIKQHDNYPMTRNYFQVNFNIAVTSDLAGHVTL